MNTKNSSELLENLCDQARTETSGYSTDTRLWEPTQFPEFCEWWKNEGHSLSPRTAWFMEHQMIAAVAFEAGRLSTKS